MTMIVRPRPKAGTAGSDLNRAKSLYGGGAGGNTNNKRRRQKRLSSQVGGYASHTRMTSILLVHTLKPRAQRNNGKVLQGGRTVEARWWARVAGAGHRWERWALTGQRNIRGQSSRVEAFDPVACLLLCHF